jgi:hypothetical protein
MTVAPVPGAGEVASRHLAARRFGLQQKSPERREEHKGEKKVFLGDFFVLVVFLW